MTQEEKAKAYDEALDRMKYVVVVPKDEKALQALKETIFPELADSEDERIRKEIIDYLGLVGKGKGDYAQPMIDRWIIYLEKLNGFQFNYPGIYFYDGEKLHFQGNPAMEENPYDFAMSQQEEQKPVDSEDKFESIDNAFRRGRETGFREGVESVKQSVEWSEEDEQWLESIIKDYEDSLTKDKDHAAIIKVKMDFLKSRRPKPQMLEDWTSEDDELLANVLGCITLVQTYKACGDLKEFKMKYTGEELRSFVRSLKSRPRKQPYWKPSEQEKGALRTAIYILTNERNFPKAAAQLQNILDAFEGKESRKDWKPSEEQMEALKWLVEYVSPSEKYIVIVKNLYEQLKKFT